jgi:hypothetical protein
VDVQSIWISSSVTVFDESCFFEWRAISAMSIESDFDLHQIDAQKKDSFGQLTWPWDA